MAHSKSILGICIVAAVVACHSSAPGPQGPHFTGGNCGLVAFEGRCQLTIARIGTYPEASDQVIVDTNWQPENADAGTQYFTCGPAFAVPARKGEALRHHLKANDVRACKGTFATGSCNPCPVAALTVDLPPFEDTPLTPIASDLVRF